MDYRDYQNARDASWQMLIDVGVNRLPVKISGILKALNIPAGTYKQNLTLIQTMGLTELVRKTDGFTVLREGRPYIFYNGDMLPARIRFTLAHELGHLVLHNGFSRFSGGVVTRSNAEPGTTRDPEEQAADVFAVRLLAPACVLHELRLFDAGQIAEVCQISRTAAGYRLRRLLLLEERGCYYLNPVERQVRDQFAEFIRNYKSSG